MKQKTTMILKSSYKRILASGKEVPITYKYELSPESTPQRQVWVPA
jgi:hypothetical protein